MNVDGFEIERRFLISFPDSALLEKCESSSGIVQTYLKRGNDCDSERVRMRRFDGGTEYTYTRKRRLSDIRRQEDERLVDEREYNLLLESADPERRPIEKTRYCLRHKGQLFEIDVFPFWQDRAIMEIELTDEKQEVIVPEDIVVFKEITGDGKYTNSSLALSIPYEEL